MQERPSQQRLVCADCDHVILGGVSGRIEICTHIANVADVQDLVDGSRRRLWTPAQLRTNPNMCGPEGKWFKPQSKWRRLWRRLFGS